MSDKAWLGETTAVNIPLQSPNEDETKMDENPPLYQNPRVDFSSGWKDWGFAIAFWIHAVIVIILALVLGVPTMISYIKLINEVSKKAIEDNNQTLFNNQTSFNIEMKPIVLGLSSAAAVAGLSSFFIFFLLQQCASQFIKCSYMIIIIMQVLVIVGLSFVFWPLCFIPGLFLSLILICFCCMGKRIRFAEAHLKAGCAALRSHPSLILVAIIMLIIEFLWFIFWFLMVLGIHRAATDSTSISQINTNETMSNTTAFNIVNTKPMWITTTPSFNDRKFKKSNSTTYSMREKQKRMNKTIYEVDEQMTNFSENANSTSQNKGFNNYGQSIVGFILLLSWYWGAITFGNLGHFITACMVGQWWFEGEESQQYSMKKSIKRAFTTSFGTICFGSFFEALIKALRRTVEDKNRRNKSIIACIIVCILQLIEKVIGYLNEWAFIFAALTGQGFVQASKSFIELFKKRGWTVIINDAVIGTTLTLINIGIAIMSAAAGGLTIYFIIDKPIEQLIFIIIIVIFVSFIIGILMSSVITTILISCVRTVFVCFALNPAALGATHPERLQDLTKVWHEFYPQEFANSGYANQFKNTIN
jgi:hypothetical protein